MNQKQHDIGAALQECRTAAREGYRIAKDNLQETAKAIQEVSSTLSSSLKSLDNGSVRTPGVVDQLKSQLVGVVSELELLQKSSVQNLNERKKNLDHFSITLFGRTMAGKSTLMEILTRGDGKTIGTGSQRTTRDVRSYSWNGLEVTDVPGVAAFEGSEDEELAFKAATKADLVLFLITDDAPQPAEAECLARVRRLGKPVLGICNVKVGLDDEADLTLFLRNPAKPFDRIRIGQILSQFNHLTDKYIPGKRVPFVVAHLRAQYLAQQKDYEKYRDQLIKASRFSGIENRIIKEVTGRGTFLRVKSFIDGAVTPMMELSELLLEFSEQNSSSGRVLIGKRRQFKDWSDNFKKQGAERLNTQISKLMDTLRSEVPAFAEDNYDSNSAQERWNRIIESIGIKIKIEKLQKVLLDDCKKALSEIARELKSELSLVADLSSDRHIKMDSIFDFKRAWNWGTNILVSGLAIAAVILGSGPLGWAAAAVGAIGWLFSLFFDDRETKVRRAREKLSQRLYEHIDKIEKNLRKGTSEWFHQELLNKQVYVLLQDLGAVTAGLFELADAQRTLAWTLNDRQKVLGKTLIKKVLDHLESANLGDEIVDVARVPGFAVMLLITPSTIFPGEVVAKMEKILGEQVLFVIDTKNQFSILSQAIGKNCDRKKISIEEKIRVAHVPLDDLDATTRSRLRLAQQLTGLHVMR
ncbi:GTPase [Desulfuribacillus alkaliarsenatis]|uniref:G domain-containing protein n=1 Tax=Desulfuribacillus alkaliarsenatis TaxID=766136 RepID=A0A1E5G014_9FIRM|nr:GTPase [Desulfuribacillus alkaliarsenatis]OEF96166.1 hypothetical protein BHF68_08335 [Desulfuribacillus alkaliarsenatis]